MAIEYVGLKASHRVMDGWWEWLVEMEWQRVIPEVVGKAAGVLLGIGISWWVLFRKRLKYLDRLRRGDSDELLFQAHYLLPVDNDVDATSVASTKEPASRESIANSQGSADQVVQLIFRNVAPRRTIDDAYDNPSARETLRKLATQTTLDAPIVPTEGRVGFEILNDAASILTGWLATSSMPRRVWLFCMTCEDRNVVRKECIRCFLFKEDELLRFADWEWCRRCVRVEKPWHWLRVVTLHRIARYYRDEQIALPQSADRSVPFVDDQRQHHRIMRLSLGISQNEVATNSPCRVDWDDKEPQLVARGVQMFSG
ncbi:hypothetical protein LOC71_16515 [Rhodopirellula sp. JC740]|uniref:Transmembrane protein n=1 Tax=Rhodopirellula halodulae TaxID=2894198 RepID=A0ABS8NK04_9BACT|nr:hypothetical protein [Rhodopirellula sp. JC740]MCC9643891.1 hypothetical protein [Rhodopirellula sp. JC740]